MDKPVIKKLSKVVCGCIFALSASLSYSGTMGPESIVPAGRAYLGAFGGWGKVGSVDMNLHGTAFFTEAAGGPLAVNAFGTSGSESTGVVGGHVGYAWANISQYWGLMPAVELEGYYMGGVDFQGNDVNNDTVRLSEHNFQVTYPVKTGVFLVNAILNSNNSMFGKFRPYIGVGIGSAVMSISDATSIQIDPPEPNLNHFNSNTNNTAVAFAAQPKIGMHFDISPRASIFAEYRFLYVSQTNYHFGSTVAIDHAATSPWLVNIKSQHYNMGTIGIDFDV